MIKYEFLIFLGLGLALAIAELVSVRRSIRRAREAENALDGSARREQGASDRDERGP